VPRLDAHQHFWRYAPEQYAWIDARMQRIARDFLPEHLAPELAAAGIDGCIAVQAKCTAEETTALLGFARTAPFVAGVVGWTDLCAPDAADAVAALAREPALRGLRHVVQSEPDDFLRREDFQRGVRALARHGLVYDVLVYPRQLAAAAAFVRALPDQPFVLDHCGKPDVAAAQREGWEHDFRALARLPNVACKLSGLVTEAAWHAWRPEHFTFYLDTALDAFGEDRLLFGSDWPVCLVAARDYRQVHDLIAGWAQRLSPAARTKLFGGNAARIYGIA
jgi:L-fuconolactonase